MAARNRTRKTLHTKPLGDGHFDSEISPRDHQKKSEHPDRDSEERRDLERRRRARFAKSRAANGREDGGSRVFLCRKAAAVPKPERRGTRMTYAKLTRRKTPSRQGKKKKKKLVLSRSSPVVSRRILLVRPVALTHAKFVLPAGNKQQKPPRDTTRQKRRPRKNGCE